jgi:PIN domain nuclease of toxin-antitoxin system
MANRQSLLLDTHVFVWALEQVDKIGQTTLSLMQSGAAVYVSKVTLWELAIKYRTQKFPYETDYLLEGMKLSGFSLLDIDTDHLQKYAAVELSHKDPFDVLLIAQAEVEHFTFVTADRKILVSSYNLQDASR